MKFLRMILANCKKYMKDYKNIICMFIIPIACVAFVHCFNNNSGSSQDVNAAFVNLDQGDLGNKFIKSIGASSVYMDENMAIDALKDYYGVAVYVLPENFTELINVSIKPTINTYKITEGNATDAYENKIEQKLNNLLETNILKSNGEANKINKLNKNLINVHYKLKKGMLSADSIMTVGLILFFMLTFSSNFCLDLLALRKQKILERFLSTNNSGYSIMGSIYCAMFIVQVVLYTASFLVMKIVFKIKFDNFVILLLNIALMSMLSISLVIMLCRIFKEAVTATMTMYLVSMVFFFLYIASMTSDSIKGIPKILTVISKFSPFYWSLGSVEKSTLFPNVFVLILMSLVFFTAGSIRYSNFAKK